MFECLCICLQSGFYRATTPFLFLSQTLSKNVIKITTLGGLFVQFDSELPCHLWKTIHKSGPIPRNGVLKISLGLMIAFIT